MFAPAAPGFMISFNEMHAPTLPLLGWVDDPTSDTDTRPAVYLGGRLLDATNLFGGIKDIHVRASS